MKSKQLVPLLAIFPFFATYACHQSGPILQPDRICEDVTGLNLTDQFKAGILQQKITLREIDPHTLIHKAILENAPEVIRFLLRQGVSIDYLDENGMSPLTLAILNKCHCAIGILLNYGADINLTLEWQHGRSLNSLKNEIVGNKEFSQELQRIVLENKQVIDTLQREISDVHQLQDILVGFGNNIDSLPALHYACKKGDRKAVELLLENGADVNARGGIGDYIAFSEGGHVAYTALHQSIISGHTEIAQLLLDNGADINAFCGRSLCQRTAIHYAAKNGNPDLIYLLHERGADINKKVRPDCPQDIETPLHIAVECGNFNAVVALIKLGAEVNTTIQQGLHGPYAPKSPLDIAIKTLKYSDNPQHLDLVKFLVENGARRNFGGYNGINCPVIKGYLESVGR